MLEEGITALLTADAGLTALIGTNFSAVVLPQSAAKPALTYQVISASRDYSLEGIETSEKRIQFDAWADAYGDCKRVLKALRNALDNFQGALPDGTRLLGAQRGIEIDFWEPVGHTYRVTAEYTLQFIEV